jgi:type IV pilus biogenesis protein CpaD/CtpE
MPVVRVALAALVAASLAACASAPAAQPDLTPPPRRPVDAKTQLEYGNPPPPPPGRY